MPNSTPRTLLTPVTDDDLTWDGLNVACYAFPTEAKASSCHRKLKGLLNLPSMRAVGDDLALSAYLAMDETTTWRVIVCTNLKAEAVSAFAHLFEHATPERLEDEFASEVIQRTLEMAHAATRARLLAGG